MSPINRPGARRSALGRVVFAGARRQGLLVAMLAGIAALSACQKSSFRRPTRKDAPAIQETIQTMSTRSATTTQLGRGRITVNSAGATAVQCTQCSRGLEINFVQQGAGTFVSEFNHPFVKDTKICELGLTIQRGSVGDAKNVRYGLYFCPLVQGARRCTKAGAQALCP